MGIAIVIGILFLIYIIYTKKQQNKTNQPVEKEDSFQTNETTSTKQDYTLQYQRKNILTGNEWNFYIRTLKDYANKNNLCVLTKIRLADLVETLPTLPQKQSYGAFQKIKAKHIDFALATPENLEIVLLIELNDNSHNKYSRQNRDKFVFDVLRNCGYNMIYTYGVNFETQANDILSHTCVQEQGTGDTGN
ncbi:MAG: DUF2726 domain-containing protein [Oscillospiraceae bacterium]